VGDAPTWSAPPTRGDATLSPRTAIPKRLSGGPRGLKPAARSDSGIGSRNTANRRARRDSRTSQFSHQPIHARADLTASRPRFHDAHSIRRCYRYRSRGVPQAAAIGRPARELQPPRLALRDFTTTISQIGERQGRRPVGRCRSAPLRSRALRERPVREAATRMAAFGRDRSASRGQGLRGPRANRHNGQGQLYVGAIISPLCGRERDRTWAQWGAGFQPWCAPGCKPVPHIRRRTSPTAPFEAVPYTSRTSRWVSTRRMSS